MLIQNRCYTDRSETDAVRESSLPNRACSQ